MTDPDILEKLVLGEYYHYRRKIVVEWGHCDPAGIVYHPRFIEYLDGSVIGLFETALGMRKYAMREAYGMYGIPIVDLNVRFVGACRFGDEIEAHTAITAMNRSSMHLRVILTRQGRTMVDCSQMRVWCGLNPNNPSELKAVEIPPEVRRILTRRAPSYASA